MRFGKIWHPLAVAISISGLLAASFASAATFEKNHSLWDVSPDISLIQQLLNCSGLLVATDGPGSPGNETNLFGLRTLRAIVRFQLANQLPATGYFGPLTRALINSTYCPATPPNDLSTSTPAVPPSALIPQPVSPGNGYTPGFGGGGHRASGRAQSFQHAPADTTAPTISSVATSTSETSIIITWTTDEPAESHVDYGTTASYGSTVSDTTMATSHSSTITGLSAATTYHFRIHSIDSTGNIGTSDDQTLTTWAVLPSLPLASGAKVMSFGHSYVQGGWFTDAPSTPLALLTERTNAVLPWIKFYDQRFNTDVWADINAPYYNATNQPSASVNGAGQGIGGDQLIGITDHQDGALSRVDYMIARDPDIIYLTFGINDVINGGYSNADTIIDYYDQLLERIRAAGIWVLADKITPVTSAWIPDGDTRLQIIQDFNDWLDDQVAAGRSGLKVADTTSVIGTGDRPSQSYWLTTDGLHLQDRGAHALAKDAVLPVLQSMVSSGTYYPTDQTLASNLMPDKTLTGTSGTKGTNTTGDVATNYSATVATGASTVVASKEDIDGTYAKQMFTITPVTDANTNHALRLAKTASSSLSTLGLEEGDWVQMMLYVEVSAWDHWTRVGFSIPVAAGTTAKFTMNAMRNLSSTAGYVLPVEGFSGWIISDPFQIPTGQGVDNVRFNGSTAILDLQWKGAATGTGVIKVSRPIFREISEPRTVWNLP